MCSNNFILVLLVILPMCSCRQETGLDHIHSEEKLLYARMFNQTCEHDGQCADHRLTCYVEEYTREKRCLCVKYHSWDIYSQQCLVAGNMTEMLSQLVEHYDAQAEELEEAQKIFSGMMIAGIIVLVIGVTMAGVCTFIACYRPSPKENIKHKDVSHQRRSSSFQDRPGTSGIQRAASPRRDGTVDYIPGMFDVSAI